MIEFLKKYEVWVFLVLGPFINIFFVNARIQGFMPSYVYNTGRFCVLILLLIIILKITKGNKAIVNLFRPMLKWKIHFKWYFLCLVLGPIVALIILSIKGLYFNLNYNSFITIRFTTFKGFIALLLWAFLGEVVWVSYCIRELSKITKPFYAGLIVAVFWTLWFIPIVLLGEGVFPKIPIYSLFIYILGTAGMCAFIYNQTKSGLCVLLLQYMLNLTLASFPITPTNGGANTFTAFAVLYLVIMLSFVYLKNLKQKHYKNQ
nr:CPBP family glutamic-type intramembrane protease [uncultured Psychroserpens sp.]